MKLLEILIMVVIKEDWQVWSISFLTKKKTGSGASVNKDLTEELCKPVIKNSKEGKSMRSLKMIFGQQI